MARSIAGTHQALACATCHKIIHGMQSGEEWRPVVGEVARLEEELSRSVVVQQASAGNSFEQLPLQPRHLVVPFSAQPSASSRLPAPNSWRSLQVHAGSPSKLLLAATEPDSYADCLNASIQPPPAVAISQKARNCFDPAYIAATNHHHHRSR